MHQLLQLCPGQVPRLSSQSQEGGTCSTALADGREAVVVSLGLVLGRRPRLQVETRAFTRSGS
eukprot:199952-Hanusia_phi.AAC.1